MFVSGSTKEILVTFAPDHPSDLYSDFMHIELFGQVSSVDLILRHHQ